MKSRALLLTLGVLLSMPLLAQENEPVEAPGIPGIDVTKMIRVTGKTANGQLRLSLDVGMPATRAVRIFSEPSHTFLVVAMDGAFRSSSEGEAWRSAYMRTKASSSALSTPLVGANPHFGIPARPDGDDRIDVWANADYPDGVKGERLIGSAYVGPKDFSFGVSVAAGQGVEKTASGGVAVPLIFMHSCFVDDQSGCQQVNLGCKTANFYCCSNAQTHCCLAGCGFPPVPCCGN